MVTTLLKLAEYTLHTANGRLWWQKKVLAWHVGLDLTGKILGPRPNVAGHGNGQIERCHMWSTKPWLHGNAIAIVAIMLIAPFVRQLWYRFLISSFTTKLTANQTQL